MIVDFIDFNLLDRVGALAVAAGFALAVVTDKLVWHTRLDKAEARADRWEGIALEALHAGSQASVRAAEVAADVVCALPDPAAPNKGKDDS